MTDEAIRKSFEKWWREEGSKAIPEYFSPELDGCLRDLAHFAYKAAMDRLEQVGQIRNGYFSDEPPMNPELYEPLYRIKEEE